jgi:hypothetical protein
VLPGGRLGDAKIVRSSRDRPGTNVGAQDLELTPGRVVADLDHGQALLAMASLGPGTVRVRFTSVNGGRAGT